MKKKRAFLILLASATLITLVVAGTYLNQRGSTANLSDEEAIRQEFEKTADEALAGQKKVITSLEIEGDWAVVEYGGVYVETGEPVPAGPGLMILKRQDSRWYPADLGSSQFEEWIGEVPEGLLSRDTKEYLLQVFYPAN